MSGGSRAKVGRWPPAAVDPPTCHPDGGACVPRAPPDQGACRPGTGLSRPPTPAAHRGAATLSMAVRLGIRLNAWKTTPTVRRRYSVSSAPRKSAHLGIAEVDGPAGGSQDSGQAGQQGGLPAAARAEEKGQRARSGFHAQPVEGSDGVVATLVLDGELGDGEVIHPIHEGPPKARAGSTRPPVGGRRYWPTGRARWPAGSSKKIAHTGITTRIGKTGATRATWPSSQQNRYSSIIDQQVHNFQATASCIQAHTPPPGAPESSSADRQTLPSP